MGRNCPNCGAQVMALGQVIQKGTAAECQCSGCGATLRLGGLAALIPPVLVLLGCALFVWFLLKSGPHGALTFGLVLGAGFFLSALLGRLIVYLTVPWRLVSTPRSPPDA